MVFIKADNVTVDYPLLGFARRKRRKELRAALAKVEGRSPKRGTLRALNEVSFNLSEGQRLGVLGLNGAGKSTLLSVLAGVIEPIEGRVERYGRTVTLFNFGLGTESEASGLENLRIYGLMQGMTLREIDSITDEVVEFAELGDHIHMPLRMYSSGMRMRLALAVATSIRPDILLMDEWVGMGDQRFLRKVQTRMSQFVADAGILVLASHNRRLIEEQCDHGLVLDAGEARFLGPIEKALQVLDEVIKEKDSALGARPSPLAADPTLATHEDTMFGEWGGVGGDVR